MVKQYIAIQIARDFIDDLKNSGIKLRMAYLYGSFARNSYHEDSDIDLALIADEFTGVGFVDVSMFTGVLKNYSRIQPKTFSTEYFHKGDPFVDEIIKSGIEIPVNVSISQ